MDPLILFCKSFRDDVLRVKRLLDSVIRLNEDCIPFYLCIPKNDLPIFQEIIDLNAMCSNYRGKIEIILDEDVVEAMPQGNLETYYATKGYISQQVIKAQVWHLLKCENYLALDSDSYFTKPFHRKDFLHESGYPYTVMHDGNELISLSEKLGHPKVKEAFIRDSQSMKQEFDRTGIDYDFGPAPLIWSSKVWRSLEQHLTNTSETIWQAFNRLPSEIRWYGEALLKYQAIPIEPIFPIFNCLHYAWQAEYYKKYPELVNTKNSDIGEVVQSYWDDSLRPNFAKKSLTSRLWKKLKLKISG
jgi:hypothetical protein